MMGKLRNKITFLHNGNEIWKIEKLPVASAMDLPEKDGFITLPLEDLGRKNRFWVKRVDIKYVKNDRVHGGLATEVDVHVEYI